MKKIVLVLVGVLVIASALIAVPVSASNTGTTALTGNPASYVSITTSEASIPLTLTPGSTATDGTLGLTVSCNDPFTITVADNSLRSSELGYMGNYTSSYVAFPLNTTLASPIGLTGTTVTTTTADTVTSPISTAQTLYTGTAPVYNQALTPNTFSQQVAYTDPVLPAGSTYRIDFIFTIIPS